MASLDVSSAVSAVVSAFHGGADLMRQIKKRASKFQKAEKSITEKLLLDALEKGEAQISERYSAHYQELGIRFQTGDETARQRLLYIAVMMQSELIRSLQLALQFENASLDLEKLQEDALIHRRDTLAALDGLRDRLLNAAVPSQVQAYLDVLPKRPSFESMRTFATNRSAASADMVPQAVKLPESESEESKSGVGRLLPLRSGPKRNSSGNSTSRFSFVSNLEWLSNAVSRTDADAATARDHPALRSRPAQEVEPRVEDPRLSRTDGYVVRQTSTSTHASHYSASSDYSDKIVVEMEDTSPGPHRVPSIPVRAAVPPPNPSNAAWTPSPRSSTNTTPSINPPASPLRSPMTPSLSSPTTPGPLSPSSTSSYFHRRHPSSLSSVQTSASSLSSGGPPALLGRPTKANNYWGFCKGSWNIREDPKKGLTVAVKPCGMYTSQMVWRCKACGFEGELYGNKKAPQFNPTVHYARNDRVRYKWVFLAKSHVKQKSLGPLASTDQSLDFLANASFGCIFCVAEGKATGVFGNVDLLADHLALEHGNGSMKDDTRIRCRALLGNSPTPGDQSWDVQILPA